MGRSKAVSPPVNISSKAKGRPKELPVKVPINARLYPRCAKLGIQVTPLSNGVTFIDEPHLLSKLTPLNQGLWKSWSGATTKPPFPSTVEYFLETQVK